MSAKIRVLDEQTINQIAAGEVIENPASVIKELVENSLDAGATEVCVEILAGGRQLIRVSDNGCGMNRDDALLSLERHATSKISQVEDIFHVHTMGFRGEAVPSVASVSKFTLLTCPREPEGADGTLIIVDGGKVVKCCSAARSPGCTIEVKSLFFNVPVRRKFQRSPTYDANEIEKRMNLFSLAHPEIQFTLRHNEKTVLSVKAGEKGAWPQRIAEVLGEEFVAGTCPIQYSQGETSVHGILGVPSFTRHNRSGQYIFVNGRPIQVPMVSFAVRDAYGTMLSSGRHPIFVLFFTLPGEWVDINVHPQKREARFRRESQIREFLMEAVQKSLKRATQASSYEAPPPVLPSAPSPVVSAPAPRPLSRYFSGGGGWKPSSSPVTSPPLFSQPKAPSVPEPTQQALISAPVRSRVLSVLSPYLVVDASALPDGEDKGLAYVDPRAARSRIFYERLKKGEGEELKTPPSQRLLMPIELKLPALESSLLRAFLPELERLGLVIESSGDHSFVVKGIPPGVKIQETGDTIRELLDSLQEKGSEGSLEADRDRRLATLAQRAAVASVKALSLDMAQALVDELLRCEQSLRCPMGKPTMVFLGAEEIAQQFQKG